MIRYSYKIITEKNTIVSGTTVHFSKTLAKRKLARGGGSVLQLSVDPDSLWGKERSLTFKRGFKPLERILFFRNLAMMVDAGLPLAEALEVLRDQVRGNSMKTALIEMITGVMNGQALSKTMRPYPKFFSPFIIELIRVGEMTGMLTSTLDRISDDLEKEYEINRKVTGAIAYPLVVLTVMVIIGLVLILYVLPKVKEMFEEVGAALPWITSALLSASAFVTEHPWAMLSSILLFIAALVFAYRTKKGKYFFHGASLRFPILGELVKESNLSRFFRAVDSLISSGISIDQSVEVAGKTLNNVVYKEAINLIHPVILYGVPLTEAMKPYPHLFPPQMRRVLAVGEQTGKIGESFRRIVHYYDKSLEHKAKMITALVEPVLMVIAGIMVAMLALSIFLPLYQMADVI